MPNPVPTVGRIVHYALPECPETTRARAVGQIRPAIIVRVWSDDMVQLQVFVDGSNDGYPFGTSVVWQTSVHQHQPAEGETQRPGSWSWMPYQLQGAKP